MYVLESIGFHNEDKVILTGLRILSSRLLACIINMVCVAAHRLYILARTYAAYVAPLHKREGVFKGPLKPSFRAVCLGLAGPGSEEDGSTRSAFPKVSSLNTCAF